MGQPLLLLSVFTFSSVGSRQNTIPRLQIVFCNHLAYGFP